MYLENTTSSLRNQNHMTILQEDIFKIEAADLGKIYKIRVRHDNSGFSPAWYLEKVEIIDDKDPRQPFLFYCERWLAKNKDDMKIERSFYVKVAGHYCLLYSECRQIQGLAIIHLILHLPVLMKIWIYKAWKEKYLWIVLRGFWGQGQGHCC